jgi:hypothetical protein
MPASRKHILQDNNYSKSLLWASLPFFGLHKNRVKKNVSFCA